MGKAKTLNNVVINMTLKPTQTRAKLSTSSEDLAVQMGKINKWYDSLVPTGGASGNILEWDSDGVAKWVSPSFLDEKVKSTLLAQSTAEGSYRPTFVTGAGTGGVNIIDSFKVDHTPGTTSVVGNTRLVLGNATASGTANNEEGQLKLYSSGTSFHTLKGTTVSSEVIHVLPSTAGTILNDRTTTYTQTVASSVTGAYEIGKIKINGTPITIYGHDIDTTYTASDGIKIESNVIKHTNSIPTASSVFKKISYDAQGHITGTANVTKSDIPALDYVPTSMLTVTKNTNVGITPSSNVFGYVSGLTAAAWNFQQTDGTLFSQYYNDKWQTEIYMDYRTGQMSTRGKNNGTWQDWRIHLDSGNYTSYTVTKTGTGASGTWGISITGNAATATTASKLGTANKGSATKGIYLSGGTPQEMTYSLNSTVNSGTANCIAYYSGANAISSAPKVTYVNTTNSASSPATVAGLHIESPTYGNTAANMLGGVAGVFSYGDGGPQIRFKDGSSSQAGALIFTADDGAAAGASWHFVSTETDWNVISKRFHAKTSISIGTDKPSTSYNLTVNGTSYFANTIYIKGTSSGNASINYASYGNARNYASIKFYDGADHGNGVQVGGGGLTVIGGGESAQAVFDNLSTLGWSASDEVAIVASDGPIYFMTNCDAFANRKSINIDTAGYLNTGYINMNISDQDNQFSTASSIVYSNSDKYLRRVSLTKLGSTLGPYVGPYVTNVSDGNVIHQIDYHSAGTTRPVHRFIRSLRTNKLAFTPPGNITMEYSTNSGSSWTSFGYTDAQKAGPFMSRHRGGAIAIGAPASTDFPNVTTSMQTRITITNDSRDCMIDQFYIWMSTSGHDITVDIQYSTQSAKTTWVDWRTGVGLGGWDGPNVINVSEFRYGNNLYGIRFIFKITSVRSDYKTTRGTIYDIQAYGSMACWGSKNNMMAYDSLFAWDYEQKATFPAEIKVPVQLRVYSGSYGTILRSDGSDTYILLTNSGSAESGTWNNLRPFQISNSTGMVYLKEGAQVSSTSYGALSVIRTGSTNNAGIKFYNNGSTYLGSLALGSVNGTFVRFKTDESTAYEIIDRSIVRGRVTTVQNLGWTSSNDTVLPTINTIAYWNGAHSGTSSNLAYCNKGAFGTIVTHAEGDYVLKAGDTMTGVLTTKGNMYEDAYNGALNMNNSDIYGLNSIYTADSSDGAAEGIHFYRDATHVDTLWMSGGSLLFVPNRELGTSTTAANSQKVARFTANPTSGQIVVTDGTTGGIKSSGYTIAKSVPSNADFTNTWRGIQDNLTSSSNTTESLSAKQGYLLANGSARDSTKVLKTGDTMSGNLTFGSNVGIIQTQNSGSHYTTTIKWWTGGTDPGTYGPEIGQWNTGGDSTYPGRIIIMPYHKSYSSGSGPWGNTAGLCIEYNHVYIDGTELSKVGHTHSLSIAADSGTNQLKMYANTKYKITAGGSTYIFTTPADAHYLYNQRDVGITYGSSKLEWYDLSANNGTDATKKQNPTNDWYHHITMHHGNPNGYFVDIAACFHSNSIYYRRVVTGADASGGWIRLIDPSNIGYITLNATTVNTTPGSFVFGGDALLGGVNDWAGIQIEGINDRFQLMINGHLLVRQNDDATISAAGWSAWTSCLRPADVSGSGGITVTQNNVTIGSGSTATTYKGTVTISHSNSITASTSAVFKKFSYDANGHITGTAAVAASDLPSHTHAYLPLSGGTMNNNTSITIPYGTGNIIYDSSTGVSVHAPTNSGWARGIEYYVGSTWYGGFGGTGGAGAFGSLYIGKYDDKTVQIDPINKITTFNGVVNLMADQYDVGATTKTALNCHNSNITGVNSLIFNDPSDNASEGIMFYRSATPSWDVIWAKDGLLHFSTNYPTSADDLSIGSTLASSTTDAWSSIGVGLYSTERYQLKVIRTQGDNTYPSWMGWNYSPAIAFGGFDTKGVISMHYNEPGVMFISGQNDSSHTKPNWNFGISGTSGTIYNLNLLPQRTVTVTTLANQSGSFAFSGYSQSGEIWGGSDWVGIQIGDSVDKFQLTVNNGNLLVRQNDYGGSDSTHWGDWQTLAFTTSKVAKSDVLYSYNPDDASTPPGATLYEGLTLAYYQTAKDYFWSGGAINNGDNHWAHYITMKHNSNYHCIMRFPFWHPPQYIRKESSAVRGWYNFVTDEDFSAFRGWRERCYAWTNTGWYRVMTIPAQGTSTSGRLISDITLHIKRQFNNQGPESIGIRIFFNYEDGTSTGGGDPKIEFLYSHKLNSCITQVRLSKSSDGTNVYVELYYDSSSKKNAVSIRYEVLRPILVSPNPNYFPNSWLPAGNNYSETLMIPISDSPIGILALNIPDHTSQMNCRNANGYYGLANPVGNDYEWLRSSGLGLIPYESGAASSGGHSNLGTSSWYFKEAYVGKVVANTIDCEGLAPRHTNEINFKSPGSTLWFGYRIITDDKGSGTTSPATPISTYLFGCGKGGGQYASIRSATAQLQTSGASYYAELTGGSLTYTRTIHAPDANGTMSVSKLVFTSTGATTGLIDVPTGARYLVIEVFIAATSVKSFHKVAIDTSCTSTSLIQTTTKGQYGLQLTIQPIQFTLTNATSITGGTRYTLTLSAGSVMSISAGTTPSAASASPQITKVYAQA